ncbi:MAG: hypothetical protein ACXWZB_06115 [Gaiellaceae bacterium]
MIVWRLHLSSTPADVHALLATDAGRVRFWAESALQRGDTIEFAFPDGSRFEARVRASDPPSLLELDYFGGPARFELADDGAGGTDLTLRHDDSHPDTRPGWVSELLALKAAADHGVDLRNHDRERTWEQGFVDN